jgi:hypothetical protein
MSAVRDCLITVARLDAGDITSETGLCDDLSHERCARTSKRMNQRRSPTIRRRRLGAELRRYRDVAGVTIDVVAD